METKIKAWGSTKLVFNKSNVEVHDIFVHKGGFCSRHLHNAKFNQFVVKRGALKICIEHQSGSRSVVLRTGESLTVHPGVLHWFDALEDTEALEIYWVEINKDDIVRFSQGGLYAATL